MIVFDRTGQSYPMEDGSVYTVFRDINLKVEEGEFLCLLGPSGCGKSTLLNLAGGFEQAWEGNVVVHGERVTKPSVDRGVVFQSSEALFEWLTVRDNIAFGLVARKWQTGRIETQVDHYLRLVGLHEQQTKRPSQISGGMKQRVQIARVLANESSVLLMDEPFGALDAQTRRNMQDELARIWTAERKTVLFITHDIEEAIVLADRIAVMTKGPGSSICLDVRVELPRPRERGPAFYELWRRIETYFGH